MIEIKCYLSDKVFEWREVTEDFARTYAKNLKRAYGHLYSPQYIKRHIRGITARKLGV